MRKLIVCAAMALTLGMAGLAQAGCTAEEAQQKAATFAQVVQAKAQQDPEGYAKVMQELQPELLQIQQKQDVDALCAFYDKAPSGTSAVCFPAACATYSAECTLAYSFNVIMSDCGNPPPAGKCPPRPSLSWV